MSRVVEWWIACDVINCGRRERQTAHETATEARARLALVGWWRHGRSDFCPLHPQVPVRRARR